MAAHPHLHFVPPALFIRCTHALILVAWLRSDGSASTSWTGLAGILFSAVAVAAVQHCYSKRCARLAYALPAWHCYAVVTLGIVWRQSERSPHPQVYLLGSVALHLAGTTLWGFRRATLLLGAAVCCHVYAWMIAHAPCHHQCPPHGHEAHAMSSTAQPPCSIWLLALFAAKALGALLPLTTCGLACLSTALPSATPLPARRWDTSPHPPTPARPSTTFRTANASSRSRTMTERHERSPLCIEPGTPPLSPSAATPLERRQASSGGVYSIPCPDLPPPSPAPASAQLPHGYCAAALSCAGQLYDWVDSWLSEADAWLDMQLTWLDRDTARSLLAGTLCLVAGGWAVLRLLGAVLGRRRAWLVVDSGGGGVGEGEGEGAAGGAPWVHAGWVLAGLVGGVLLGRQMRAADEAVASSRASKLLMDLLPSHIVTALLSESREDEEEEEEEEDMQGGGGGGGGETVWRGQPTGFWSIADYQALLGAKRINRAPFAPASLPRPGPTQLSQKQPPFSQAISANSSQDAQPLLHAPSSRVPSIEARDQAAGRTSTEQDGWGSAQSTSLDLHGTSPPSSARSRSGLLSSGGTMGSASLSTAPLPGFEPWSHIVAPGQTPHIANFDRESWPQKLLESGSGGQGGARVSSGFEPGVSSFQAARTDSSRPGPELVRGNGSSSSSPHFPTQPTPTQVSMNTAAAAAMQTGKVVLQPANVAQSLTMVIRGVHEATCANAAAVGHPPSTHPSQSDKSAAAGAAAAAAGAEGAAGAADPQPSKGCNDGQAGQVLLVHSGGPHHLGIAAAGQPMPRQRSPADAHERLSLVAAKGQQRAGSVDDAAYKPAIEMRSAGVKQLWLCQAIGGVLPDQAAAQHLPSQGTRATGSGEDALREARFKTSSGATPHPYFSPSPQGPPTDGMEDTSSKLGSRPPPHPRPSLQPQLGPVSALSTLGASPSLQPGPNQQPGLTCLPHLSPLTSPPGRGSEPAYLARPPLPLPHFSQGWNPDAQAGAPGANGSLPATRQPCAAQCAGPAPPSQSVVSSHILTAFSTASTIPTASARVQSLTSPGSPASQSVGAGVLQPTRPANLLAVGDSGVLPATTYFAAGLSSSLPRLVQLGWAQASQVLAAGWGNLPRSGSQPLQRQAKRGGCLEQGQGHKGKAESAAPSSQTSCLDDTPGHPSSCSSSVQACRYALCQAASCGVSDGSVAPAAPASSDHPTAATAAEASLSDVNAGCQGSSGEPSQSAVGSCPVSITATAGPDRRGQASAHTRPRGSLSSRQAEGSGGWGADPYMRTTGRGRGPPSRARRLSSFSLSIGSGRHTTANWHEQVSILFSDIVGFSSLSAEVAPEAVFAMLNELYSHFDVLTQFMPSIYKIETIGDSYMVTAGLLVHDPEHAATMVRFGLAMQQVAAQVMMPNGGGPVQMRIGIHSGPVLSGVIGKIRKRFCLVGHTVNCASRMESGGIPGRIQVSSSTHALLQHCSEFQWESRGPIEVKGLGTMTPYLLIPLDDQTMDILLSQDDVAEALSAVRGQAATAAEEPLTHREYRPLQRDSLSYDPSERSSSPARLPAASTSCGLSNMSGVSPSSNATHAGYLSQLPAIDCEDPLMWECTSAHAMHTWLSADMQRAQKGRTACSLAAAHIPAAPASQCDSASRPRVSLGVDTDISTCCVSPGAPGISQDSVAGEHTAQLAQQELEKEQALIAELDDVFYPKTRRRGSCIWGLTEDVQPHMLAANQLHRPPADVLGSHAGSFAFMQPGNDRSDNSSRRGREG